jgi:large repetitive protein
MKYERLFPLVALLFFAISCHDEIIYDENPFLNKKKELDFKSLQAIDPVVVAGGVAHLKAVATGDSLVFVWFAAEGNLQGSDTLATFSNEEEGVFEITCTVSDKYGNTDHKQVSVRVTSELVFTGLDCPEPVIPENYDIGITAVASGEDLTFEWTTSGGSLSGDGKTVQFSAAAAGNYSIACTVTDFYGESQSHVLELTVVKGFVFKSLSADPNRIPANDVSHVTATALGHGLTYNWRVDPPASLLGSGHRIVFTICHADVFTVFCDITDDQGNTQTKSVTITVTD